MKSILQTLAEIQSWNKSDLAKLALGEKAIFDVALSQEWVNLQYKQNPNFETGFWVWVYEDKKDFTGRPVHLLEHLFKRLRSFDYMDCEEWIKERIQTEEAYLNTVKRLFT